MQALDLPFLCGYNLTFRNQIWFSSLGKSTQEFKKWDIHTTQRRYFFYNLPFLELSNQIDVLLENVKDAALNDEDIQLVIKLVAAGIVMQILFMIIVISYIIFSCYVMIYKQKVFSEEHGIGQNLKERELSNKFLRNQNVYKWELNGCI